MKLHSSITIDRIMASAEESMFGMSDDGFCVASLTRDKNPQTGIIEWLAKVWTDGAATHHAEFFGQDMQSAMLSLEEYA